MPELPEVETTRLGIEPWIKNSSIESVIVRNPSLRWPVSIPDYVCGQKVLNVRRRAKYLLIDLVSGSLIGHLGMSGSLRIVRSNSTINKHDHLDIVFAVTSHGGTLPSFSIYHIWNCNCHNRFPLSSKSTIMHAEI